MACVFFVFCLVWIIGLTNGSCCLHPNMQVESTVITVVKSNTSSQPFGHW